MWGVFAIGFAYGIIAGILLVGWAGRRSSDVHWQDLLKNNDNEPSIEACPHFIEVCPHCHNPKMYHPNNECIQIYPEYKA